MENFLALPEDVHDWAFKDLTTTSEGEEGGGSRRTCARIESHPSDQFFNIEYLVHRKTVAGEMITILGKAG